MEFRHVPVLLDECLEGLSIKPDGIYVDGTLGGGGHASAVCERLSGSGTLIGIDRDRDAIDAAGKRLENYPCRKIFVNRNYSDIKEILKDNGIDSIDGALLDLGVSSFQLDNAERGFSYMNDAPLDMRMNRDDSLTAKDVVNGYSRADLTRIISAYGEERWASRIASFIEEARKEKPIETTTELAEIVKHAIPAKLREGGGHPAKRTFQAIRIELNRELDILSGSIDSLIDLLNPGGRLAIITFHSLEDKIVKSAFRTAENPCICPPDFPVCVCGRKSKGRVITRRPVTSSEEELKENNRAHSAKLRIFEKV